MIHIVAYLSHCTSDLRSGLTMINDGSPSYYNGHFYDAMTAK